MFLGEIAVSGGYLDGYEPNLLISRNLLGKDIVPFYLRENQKVIVKSLITVELPTESFQSWEIPVPIL